eukprot:scaffold176735_cov22-Tisochrysis_lutea.AAC.3
MRMIAGIRLQLALTLHIFACRYEDDGWAWAGHRLAVGVLLGRVAAHTVDEQGKPAFVTSNVLLLLRKVCAAAATPGFGRDTGMDKGWLTSVLWGPDLTVYER